MQDAPNPDDSLGPSALSRIRADLLVLPVETVRSPEDLRSLRKRVFQDSSESIAITGSHIVAGSEVREELQGHLRLVEKILRSKWPDFVAAVVPSGGWVERSGV